MKHWCRKFERIASLLSSYFISMSITISINWFESLWISCIFLYAECYDGCRADSNCHTSIINYHHCSNSRYVFVCVKTYLRIENWCCICNRIIKNHICLNFLNWKTGKEKSPDLDDGGTGLPPRDDDGGGGGGGGGGGWSRGGFFFFGFLAFLGFLKDQEKEGAYRDWQVKMWNRFFQNNRRWDEIICRLVAPMMVKTKA